jgi:hypothetical protein
MTTNQNVTITGQVTDDRPGSSLQAQVDSGASAAVSLDASGNFSFTTGLLLDGSADGSHAVHLRATDRAGNASGVVDVPFLLDTQPPTITVSSPTSGGVTRADPTVTGRVTDAVSGVASLQEAVDAGSYGPFRSTPAATSRSAPV